MRRGHPGRGGWRSEGPSRHFRPRSGGPGGFRPSRNFPPPIFENPRFPPPNLGLQHSFPGPPPPFKAQQGFREDHSRPTHYGRNPYLTGNHHNQKRNQDNNASNEDFTDNPDYYINEPRFLVNEMGDTDHRPPYKPTHHGPPFNQRKSAWNNQNLEHDTQRPYGRRQQSDRYQDDYGVQSPNKMPVQGYPGHRPPSSDHYQAPTVPTIDNSETFSRSVDDTVDIIRRKLLNRNEPLAQRFDNEAENRDNDVQEPIRDSTQDYVQNSMQQEHTPKNKTHKPKQNLKANCKKIKTKIVHQLFKMDKERIHKLMDNPNSSTKFEYAINSLITESQNSYNRHQRAAAEKSLCGFRSEFIQYNDSDTIYEDTFMKQMQCILDPQDTIILEDIKPIVMAELNKVLQLDEYDQRFEMPSEEPSHVRNSDVNYELSSNTEYDSYRDYQKSGCNTTFQRYSGEDYSKSDPSNFYGPNEDSYSHCDQTALLNHYPEDVQTSCTDTNAYIQEYHDSDSQEPKDIKIVPNVNQENLSKLFERRSARKISENSRRRSSAERKRHSSELFTGLSESEAPTPLFDYNAEQLTDDDDDPFAELDKQYHVPVDHNFIQNDEPTLLKDTVKAQELRSHAHIPGIQSSPDKGFHIKQETYRDLDMRLPLNTSMIPCAKTNTSSHEVTQDVENSIKQEILSLKATTSDFNDKKEEDVKKELMCIKDKKTDLINVKEKHAERKNSHEDKRRSETCNNTNSSDKKSNSTNSRKRSVEQYPSHRKEKRKKTDSIQQDTKQILNKNIIINLTDCVAKKEKCDTNAKSVFNLFFAKDEVDGKQKENKKNPSDGGFTEKYVKRKESPTNTIEGCGSNRKNRSNSSHSMTSPIDSSSCSHASSKTENKIKLKPIDMFSDQTKTPAATVHQSHRNTAPNAPLSNTPRKEKVKTLPLKSISKQVSRRHISTQVAPKLGTKETQTKYKTVTIAVQTSPVKFEKSVKKTTDTYERMKEIDMEIQELLQEKFKLYNSLESKQATSLPSLGMAVLNVAPTDEKEDDNVSLSPDDIIDNFTSIPEDELELIALETVDCEPKKLPAKPQKKGRRPVQKKDNKRGTRSPLIKKTPRKEQTPKKTVKSPNISLIEQIITDDRPLEDIISLDDFETSPIKIKIKKNPTPKSKRSHKKKTKTTETYKVEVLQDYKLKECFVKLVREDMSKLLKSFTNAIEETDVKKDRTQEVIEETIVSDMHFQVDMLDVSEDIVIGSNCEVGKVETVQSETITVPNTDDIVLDNSQEGSHVAEHVEVQQSIVCKMYDYSADEDLRHDSIVVAGNGDSVLAIECVENNFLAACLDGNVYYFGGDGRLLATLRGSNLAVTCLTIVRERAGTTVYTGSLDSRIRYYDLESGLEKGPECNVLSPIQTMDRAWDTVFVGTRTGFVLQFECKNNMLIPVSTIKFSDQSILALRAIKEGPRKVLLVAARSENVTIKDAQTGLLLRTLEGPRMTVYTLLYEDGKIFCGTNSHQIQVFDYASGSHMGEHEGGKGAVCLRATGGVLFAGCYDGCVYAFRAGERSPFAQLRGPSVMLLSLAIVGSKIIAGYNDRSLYIWKIPANVLQEMVL